MKKHIAIIVAGGTGSRMGTSLPKQFMMLGGVPILCRSIELFSAAHKIIVSMHPASRELWMTILKEFPDTPGHEIVDGGDTRYQSVKNALAIVDEEEAVVSIHDAVRPLASAKLIDKCFDQAGDKGSAVPLIPTEDTIREIDDGSRIVDRSKLFRVQTPQSFDAKLIKKAYSQPFQSHFTDDASLLEEMGVVVHFVEGEKFNMKLTHPEDLKVMEGVVQLTVGSRQ